MTAHDDLRSIAELAARVVDAIPERPLPGSPRDAETRLLSASSGGEGRSRASLLDSLNVDMQLMVGYLNLVAAGVSDDLEIASLRNNAVNGPALAFIVRPALELAGQVAWLLNDQLDAENRARRYIVWRLADLRSQRLLLRDFRSSGDEMSAAVAELDESEQELLAMIAAAKWTAKPSSDRGEHFEAATLRASDGRPERLPSLGALVGEVSSSPAAYSLLSVTNHSHRFGLLQGLEVVGEEGDGSQDVRVGGFPINPNLLIGFSVLAVSTAGRLLAGWNGTDAGELFHFGRELMDQLFPD